MRWFALFLLVLLVCGSSLGETLQAPRAAFLTGPSSQDPLEIALDYLGNVRPALMAAQAMGGGEWVVKDRYRTRHNGLTHLHLRRKFGGIELFNGDVAFSVMPDGRLVGLRASAPLATRLAPGVRAPALTALEATRLAAAHLGLTLSEPLLLRQDIGGPVREVRLSKSGISLDDIPVKLMYFASPEAELRLVWNLLLRLPDRRHWWSLNVDAITGEVLVKYDRVKYDSYKVFAQPLGSPDDGERTLEVDPADPNASPFGWHDTNGSSGAECTDTCGNNVSAQEDVNSNNLGGFRPSGGAGLDFDFPLDPNQDPDTYQAAAITNLFYWNNILHDIHYQYGFDEASGNFQENNYGRGGLGGDAVNADAQDGGIPNNARIFVTPDGTSPRMEMGIWQLGELRVNTPGVIAGTYPAGVALFGPLTLGTGTTGELVQALDPADPNNGPSTTDACLPLTNAAEIAGNIALVDRGDCFFVEKVSNAQAAGAIAVVVVNNQGDGLVDMAGEDPNITIPSVFIGQSHGDLIKARLAAGVNVTLFNSLLDSDLDNMVVTHEYGHGVSTRLTGGPANEFCLEGSQSAGLGEGWSDWWALALTALSSDAPEDPRGIGTYLVGQPPEAPGIRNFPYSTDLAVNPQTFADITSTGFPHGVGEIWAVTLWDMFWNLVEERGFDPDLYQGTAGNNLALQLVMDGLKLQPCDPSFLEARDAILLADLVDNAGANQCTIWRAFAKRGMGVDALSAPVSEDFATPPECGPCGDLNADGVVNQDDLTLLRGFLADPSTLTPAEQTVCVAHAVSGDCDILEVVILTRALGSLPPGLSDSCTAAESSL